MGGVPFLISIEFDGGKELLRVAARLQIVARKYGFKPTWLVGAEALRHPSALEPLVRWQAEREAEVGVLLEAGSVPPFVEIGAGPRPFLTDFPESIMDEKLAWLTAALGGILGRRPVVLRSSRPSVDDRYYSVLSKHGYKVDLTVVPHARIGTSDFRGYSEKAYLTPQGVFEVPQTVRRRRYGPLIEDLVLLPGLSGGLFRRLFPTLRNFYLRSPRKLLRVLAQEGVKAGSSHLDLRITTDDWVRGDRLVRDLEKFLAEVQTGVEGLGAEEFLQRYKNEQLRKGLV